MAGILNFGYSNELHFIVALICIPLMTSYNEHLPVSLFPDSVFFGKVMMSLLSFIRLMFIIKLQEL